MAVIGNQNKLTQKSCFQTLVHDLFLWLAAYGRDLAFKIISACTTGWDFIFMSVSACIFTYTHSDAQVIKYESEDRDVASMKKFIESKIKVAV